MPVNIEIMSEKFV